MPGLPRGQGQTRGGGIPRAQDRSVTPGDGESPARKKLDGESPARKKLTKTTRPRSKSCKGLRSKSRTPNMSPLQAQLEEVQIYIKPHMDDIQNCKTSQDRLVMIYRLLPDDVTSIDRLWPLELTNKDSRLRIDLSEQGKDCYVAGDHKQSLELYNKALTYSSGKGIAHTLARRAAFFLATKEHQLALRDLNVALEYGVLETEELLDFLLTHHSTEDTGTTYDNEEEMMTKTIRNIQTMNSEKALPENQKTLWAKKLKENLNVLTGKKRDVVAKDEKDDILKNIVESIKSAAKEHNLDVNLESEELAVPKIEERNPLYPAFSEAAAVFKEAGDDKGRHVKARRDILAGEVIAVDEPHCAMLCPQDLGQVKNHCIHCFRFVRAPLPCENCCCVVFCSKECKSLANSTYHKYECQLRLYELLPQEGQDVFGLFMSLRSITQKPLEYFMEHQDELEKYLDRDQTKPVIQSGRYLSSDYKTLLNLVTHSSDLSDDIIMRNTILSIVFLRSLQRSGYFSKYIKARMKGDRFTITPIEILILRLLYHLIAVQSFNSHPIMRLSTEAGSFNWEKIGICLNPSMALFNHSCDANTVRCNVNKSSVLVAAAHIPAGQEITDSYAVHFSNTVLDKRQYHTLKNYMFGCECPACLGKWKLADQIPDELARVPNFEQEANFKVRFGDKKFIVGDIRDARRLAELCMNKKAFADALNAYQDLCQLLEEHVRKPHAYYLQTRAGITHCVWNKYCKPPIDTTQQEEEDEFLSGKNNPIYMNQVVENITDINLQSTDLPEAEEEESLEDIEKALLIKRTREMVKSSMDKTQGAKQVVMQNKQTAQVASATANSKASSTCSNGKSNLEPWVVEQYNGEQDRKKSVREEQMESEVGESIAMETAKEMMLVDKRRAEEMAKKKQQRQEEEKARKEEAEKRKLERQRECEERSQRLIQQDKEKRQQQKEQEERIALERKSRKDKDMERRRAKEIEETRIKRELQRQKEEEELALLINETNGNNDDCLENIEDHELINNLLKDLDNEEFLIKDEQDDIQTLTVSGNNEEKITKQLVNCDDMKRHEDLGNITHINNVIIDTKQREMSQDRTTSDDKIAKIENQCGETSDMQFENGGHVPSNMESDALNVLNVENIKIEKTNGAVKQLESSNKIEDDAIKNTKNETLNDLDDFINNSTSKKSEKKEDEDEDAGNVWAILRRIKDTNYTEDCKKEIRKEQKDLENTIKSFADIITKKKKMQEENQNRKCSKIPSDMETIEEDVLPENDLPKDPIKSNDKSNINSTTEDTIQKVSTMEEEPLSKHSMLSCIEESENFFKQTEKFDYATWREKTVIDVTPIEELSPEKLAADREYLESLKNKINTNIQKKKEVEKKDEKKEKKNTLPKLNNGKSEKKSLTEPESFESLKSKDKERKRKKRDEKTNIAVEGAKDKTKEVNLKSNKVEKRAEETKKHIEQLKEKAIALRKQSELKEMEFNDISLHFNDLSSLETKLDAKTKKGRKAARQVKENPKPQDTAEHVHWTEEETNAWPSADPNKVHSMLGAIKAAAAASASKGNKIDGKSLADDLRNKITTCHQEIEMERKQKEEEANMKRTAELEDKAKKMLENVKEENTKGKKKDIKDSTKNVEDKNIKNTQILQRVENTKDTKVMTNHNEMKVSNISGNVEEDKNDKKDKNRLENSVSLGPTRKVNGEAKNDNKAKISAEDKDKKIISMKNETEMLTNVSTATVNGVKTADEKKVVKEKVIKTSETVSRNHMESQTRNKVPSMRWSGSELFEQDHSESSDSLYSMNISPEISNANNKELDNKLNKEEVLRLEREKAKKEAEVRKNEIENQIQEQERIKYEEKEKERKRKQEEQENVIKKKAAEMKKMEEKEAKAKLEKIAIEKKKQEEKEILEKKVAQDAKKKKEMENAEKLKLKKIAQMKEKEEKLAEEQKRQEEAIRKEEARQKEIREAEDMLNKLREEVEEKKRTAEAAEKKKIEEEAALIKRRKEKEEEEQKKKIAEMKQKSKVLVENHTSNESSEMKMEQTVNKKQDMKQKSKVSAQQHTFNKSSERKMEESVHKKKDGEQVVIKREEETNTKHENISQTVKSDVKVKPRLLVVNTNTDLEASPVTLRKMPSMPRDEVLSMRWSGAEMFQDLNQESTSSFKLDVKPPTICEDIIEAKFQLPELKSTTKLSLNNTNSKTAEEVFEESILETMKQRIPSPMQIDEYAENVKRYSENLPKPNTQPDLPCTRQSKKDIFQAQNESNSNHQETIKSQPALPQARQRSQSRPRPPPPKFRPPPPPPMC